MSFATFLNGRAPDRLRGLQMLALSDTGLILTRVYASDTGGGATQVWGTAGTAQCRIDSLLNRTERSLMAGRINERSTHVITTPTGTVVQTDDRFQIAGRGTFEVTALRERSAEWSRVFEVVQVS